ncbi:hypothetical protein D3C71_1583540 [compost metagenome]
MPGLTNRIIVSGDRLWFWRIAHFPTESSACAKEAARLKSSASAVDFMRRTPSRCAEGYGAPRPSARGICHSFSLVADCAARCLRRHAQSLAIHKRHQGVCRPARHGALPSTFNTRPKLPSCGGAGDDGEICSIQAGPPRPPWAMRSPCLSPAMAKFSGASRPG